MSTSVLVAAVEAALADPDHIEQLSGLASAVGPDELARTVDLVIENHAANTKALGKSGAERLKRAKAWRAKNR